jgi:predicted methyltransferase
MILVVVGDLDFVSLAALPAKAEPVLVVDADGILALPVSAERVQAVAWWYAEIV